MTIYMDMPLHKNPWSGAYEIYNLVDPFLGIMTIYSVFYYLSKFLKK